MLGVLIVDDEPVFRNYIRQMGFWQNGEFLLAGEAGSGDEALQLLERTDVDIVIMDVSMPGKNGVVLSEILLRKYPNLALIAVSSFDDYDYVREILKNGAYDYILKGRLSEEVLLFALDNAKKRLKGRTPWEMKRELRRKIKAWLLEDGINPFTADNSRMTAFIVHVQFQEEDTLLSVEGRIEGICRIIENSSTDKMDVITCYHSSGKIVAFFRFYDTISESYMNNQLECSRIMIEDSIRRVYHIKPMFYQCPFFFSDNSLRTFVLHKLLEEEEQPKEGILLSLSIDRYRKLLSYAQNHDADKAELLIREVYDEISVDNEGQCIMITKELLEIIERVAAEYSIELAFLPREFMLFQYTRVKTRETLTDNIAGIFRNVLREIGEMENKEKGYSEVVKLAILYQKAHFHEPISLRKIAEEIGVNSSYLSRIFHEETAVTLTDYLNGIRIEEAGKLIESGIPLKEVVSRCGFRNYGYFLKTFKEYTGKTPKEFAAAGKDR
jgi:YesN/AraC family two-component response regulator